MEQLTLNAKSRTTSTKSELNNLRKARRVPGVIYGLKQESTLIDLEQNKLEKCLGRNNKNRVIEVDVEGKKERALIREITRDPVKQFDIIHVDFIRVNDEHPVVVKIPIEHEGVPFGVKNEGGFFQVMKKFVKLKCKVGDIPKIFEMDISDLHSGDIVYAKDLKVENAVVLTPPKTALYGVTGKPGTKEVEEASAPAEDDATAAEADGKADENAKADDAKPEDKASDEKK